MIDLQLFKNQFVGLFFYVIMEKQSVMCLTRRNRAETGKGRYLLWTPV